MAHTKEVVVALKQLLRAKGITYAELARRIGISESSVKRMFSTQNFSLKRLQSICDVAEVEFGYLLAVAEDNRRNVEQLSAEQEEELVSDIKLLLVTFLLLNLWTVEDILAQYKIEPLEATQLLARLDRLKIIDLLPGNRVSMRLSRNFDWRPNGPIQQFFERRVQSEFFKSRFNGPNELRLVLNGLLSEQSLAILQQRFKRLAADFNQFIKDDGQLHIDQRHGVTAILALRPWGLSVFEKLRKKTKPVTDKL